MNETGRTQLEKISPLSLFSFKQYYKYPMGMVVTISNSENRRFFRACGFIFEIERGNGEVKLFCDDGDQIQIIDITYEAL